MPGGEGAGHQQQGVNATKVKIMSSEPGEESYRNGLRHPEPGLFCCQTGPG
jgi:hypothetical protein